MPGSYDVHHYRERSRPGTLAHSLAATGKRILILERGDWLKREALNWDPKAVFVDNRYISPDTIVYLPSITRDQMRRRSACCRNSDFPWSRVKTSEKRSLVAKADGSIGVHHASLGAYHLQRATGR